MRVLAGTSSVSGSRCLEEPELALGSPASLGLGPYRLGHSASLGVAAFSGCLALDLHGVTRKGC